MPSARAAAAPGGVRTHEPASARTNDSANSSSRCCSNRIGAGTPLSPGDHVAQCRRRRGRARARAPRCRATDRRLRRLEAELARAGGGSPPACRGARAPRARGSPAGASSSRRRSSGSRRRLLASGIRERGRERLDRHVHLVGDDNGGDSGRRGAAAVASTPSAIMASTTSCATGRASSKPLSSPRPRTWRRAPAGAERAISSRSRDAQSRARSRAGPRPRSSSSTARAAAHGTGRRRTSSACSPGAEREVRRARRGRRSAARRRAPSRAHDVGHDPRERDASQSPHRPDAGLDLVGDQQRAVRGRRAARTPRRYSRRRAGARRPRPAPAPAARRATSRRQRGLERREVARRRRTGTSPRSGSNGCALRGLAGGARASRTVRPWNDPSSATIVGTPAGPSRACGRA